jgi:hypothetical protein
MLLLAESCTKKACSISSAESRKSDHKILIYPPFVAVAHHAGLRWIGRRNAAVGPRRRRRAVVRLVLNLAVNFPTQQAPSMDRFETEPSDKRYCGFMSATLTALLEIQENREGETRPVS